MAHRAFNLYKRPTTKNGKFIYYVQFYDEYGNRLTARSTGQTSKAAAENWAYEQLHRGVITTEKNITFEKFADPWWIWDKCPYIRGEIARGSSLSRAYCDQMRRILEVHILPYFRKRKLQKISYRMINTWFMNLKEKQGRNGSTLSHITCNHALTCLNVMLKEAVRQEYIHDNPASKIKRLKEDPKEKGILTIDEVKALFREENLKKIWNCDLNHYTLNLLSASTGIRMGEIQALQVQHVHENYISVLHSWDRQYGIKEPKRNSKRNIPVPSKTANYLYKIIEASPYQEAEDFVFFGKNRAYPLRNEVISKALYKALSQIGIPEEQRKERNLTFHSWRFFYNTLLRGRIPEVKLRRLTGHRSEQMSDWYTRFDYSDYQDVLKIQEEYFK